MKRMAKKWLAVLLVLCTAILFCACSRQEEDFLHNGLNAVITSIDAQHQILTVKDPSASDPVVFGEESLISCKEADIIYCNYETFDMQEIAFSDLQVGDAILLSIPDSQLKNRNSNNILSADAEQIQLGTQRLN